MGRGNIKDTPLHAHSPYAYLHSPHLPSLLPPSPHLTHSHRGCIRKQRSSTPWETLSMRSCSTTVDTRSDRSCTSLPLAYRKLRKPSTTPLEVSYSYIQEVVSEERYLHGGTLERIGSPQLHEFTLGIQKAQEAINNSIGSELLIHPRSSV